MQRFVFALGILACFGVVSLSLASTRTPEEIESSFDAILSEVVEEGWVDYAKLKEDPAPLDAWLSVVEAMPSIEVKKWTHHQAVAFYINAYNGHVLRIVRDHYPIEGSRPGLPSSSIQQIDGVWKLPLRVAQRDLSLDGIEKDVLIGEYNAPRVHLALVCASVGCPPIRSEAYHGASLLRELNLAAQSFLRSPRGGRVDMNEKVLYLSPIFEWYEADFRKFGVTNPPYEEVFGEDRGPMVQFVTSFFRDEERKFLRDADFRIVFFDYDWTLNDIANR